MTKNLFLALFAFLFIATAKAFDLNEVKIVYSKEEIRKLLAKVPLGLSYDSKQGCRPWQNAEKIQMTTAEKMPPGNPVGIYQVEIFLKQCPFESFIDSLDRANWMADRFVKNRAFQYLFDNLSESDKLFIRENHIEARHFAQIEQWVSLDVDFSFENYEIFYDVIGKTEITKKDVEVTKRNLKATILMLRLKYYGSLILLTFFGWLAWSLKPKINEES